jgi:histone H3/H4
MSHRVVYLKSIHNSKPQGMSICPEAIDNLENIFSDLLTHILLYSSKRTIDDGRKRINKEDIKQGFENLLQLKSNELLIEQIEFDFIGCLKKLKTIGGEDNE